MKKRADGRYLRRIKDPRSNKTIYFYGTSERDVNRQILEYERDKDQGRRFEDIATEWRDKAFPKLANQSLKGYKPAFERAVDEFGSVRISAIKPRDVLIYFDKLTELGFTKKTISNHRIVLNQIFKYAMVYDNIEFNPVSAVTIPSNAAPSKERKPASPDEEKLIFESEYPWIFPLFALLTGLRKGEILALQWRDIDFEKNTICVEKNVEHVGHKPALKVPKTDKGFRDVPLLDALKKRLVAIRDEISPKPSDYIFSVDGGKSPLKEYQYAKLYKLYKKEVGIGATAHPLRHSYATVAIEEDINPKDLQKALGHADVTTTLNIYAAAREKSNKKIAEKLNKVYTSKGEKSTEKMGK